MRTAKDIGIGVAGTGLGACLLEINLDPHSRLQVRALYDPDPGRRHQRYRVGQSLRSLAEDYGVERLTSSYGELLDQPDIGAVAIFSPCPYHHAQVTSALRAGKHVIVTKPLATSLEQARDMVALADRTGLKVLVAQSMRWNAMFQAIHALFTAGELGEVRLAESYYVHDMRTVFDSSPWRYELPQDLMYGGVCHPVDLLRWFLGEADEVFAYGQHGGLDSRYPADKEDNFVIVLKYRSGALGRVLGAYSLVHPPSLWHGPFHGVGIGLYGTEASVFNDRMVREYYGTGRAPREERIAPEGDELDHAGEVIGFLRHFEDCVVNDKKPLVDARDGAQIVAICSACWESIGTGQPVKVTREFDAPGTT